MAQTKINTIVVLRNDSTTNWEQANAYKLKKGEVGIGYLDNGNIIAKLGIDGTKTWSELPQIEGVFENDVTLTYDFGKYKTTNGFVNAGGKGMTTSEWLLNALSEIKNPVITDPTYKLSASITGSGSEIGSYVNKINWTGTTTFGSYEYGPAVGVTSATYTMTNNQDSQTATTEDGTFTVGNIQLDQEASKVYATITGKCKIDNTNANFAKNNVGQTTELKISALDKEIVAEAKATAYRKPFYGVLAPAAVVNPEALTSAIVRALPNSGKATKGLPTSISVPAGSQMVIFAAKAGTYSSLTATDDKAMNATVTFDKKAAAVKVEGANGFKAVDYDVWYVDWKAGIGSAKQLTLKWA